MKGTRGHSEIRGRDLSGGVRSPIADILETLDPAARAHFQPVESVLRQSEQRFAAFLNHLPGFAWMKTAEGAYVFVNKMVQKVVRGYASYSDYAGKTDAELWPAETAAQLRTNDMKVVQTGSPLQEFETLVMDGRSRSVLSNKFPVFDVQGRVAYVGGIAFDVTDQLQVEEDLKRANARLRELSASVQSASELEAWRISRELHDELGQALAALNLDCSFVSTGLARMPESAERAALLARIEGMMQAIQRTVTSVQRICAELRPALLDDLGLVPALELFVEEFAARTGLCCRWQAKPNEMNLSSAQALCVFRIFQEVFTNIMRHAEASQIEIRLVSDEGGVTLEISDNGRGISPHDVENRKSLGLLGMRERAFLAGGVLEIKAGPDHGTVVNLNIPLR
jgi:two-component system, NarL family, sensor histidine kinase UhpB